MAHVLIVEDDAVTALAACDALVRKGHVVETAADGAVAIAVMSWFRFDVLVTDLMLPHIRGDELIRILDAIQGRLAPVILITGAPEPQLPAGLRYDRYIGKPIDHDALAGWVDHLARQAA